MGDDLFVAGLDLGQAMDWTALAIAQVKMAARPRTYTVRHLERPDRGTSYPDIVDWVAKLLHEKPLAGHTTLAVDATGCGRPVVDMLRRASLIPWAVTLTGGYQEHFDGLNVTVPRQTLITQLLVLFQSKRITLPAARPETAILATELLHFKPRKPAKFDEAEIAWREEENDDLMFSVALACWLGERLRGPLPHVESGIEDGREHH